MNLLGKTCLVCGDRVADADRIECEACGNGIHDRCADYYQRFECPRCAEEEWIGVHEP